MEYNLIRSSRRTLAVEISPTGDVIVRAPYRCSQARIDSFLLSHAEWIAAHSERQRSRAAAHPEPDAAERERLIAAAKSDLPALTEHYASLMGLRPEGIKITGARKRFGSCSAGNSLCYSWRLMQYPKPAIEYVVVHELAHIVHKNHGRQFYELISSVLPDWKSRRALLKQ